ncbi:hypothetical protein ACFQDN_20525 [Pseudomonas asuensis]|uniref:Uncharacterized protein n=1 Tax=Pseudomonas asuensis TaxID=1825787 RepID=A0ABQ2H3Q5_9PSED|nr:hypothetical protein [Pseudomonas asuensis]GGM29148.1 hypothetical protein GCM10009425_44580 [Pseudomonas asuensis]
MFILKPTRDRLSSGPLVGEGWAGMGHFAQKTPFVQALASDPAPLRIVLVEQAGPWPTRPEALNAVRHTSEQLRHYVEPATLPIY